MAQPRMPLEIRAIVDRYRSAFITVAILSAVLNILLLAGSLYMMLVYDSVLPSQSLPSLFGLLIALIVVYLFQGVFDTMRARILNDIGNSFDRALSRRVQRAMSEVAVQGGLGPNGPGQGDGMGPMRDLESVRSFLSGSGPTSLIDLPWIVFFMGILMLIHFWTGLTALIGGALLMVLTLITNRVTKEPMARVHTLSAHRNGLAEVNMRHAETLAALGMRERMIDRWDRINRLYIAANNSMARSIGTLGGIGRIGRMLLQSLILTVGAILVIEGKASGGAIFASSILSARALAPIDQLIGNWRSLAAARIGWARLCELVQRIPAPADAQVLLPAPESRLEVEQLVVAPPGTQTVTVQGVQFALSAGDGLAIIGPSAAGKSSLSRALMGIWRPVRGSVRLDGAALDQWPSDLLGQHLGYLPQTVDLIDGTVADNIARFDPGATSEKIVAAARSAGVHDMIVALPNGYETEVGPDGRNLSSGQQQRIALARALYGDPFLVLLDEPNSNLDADGDAALEQAISGVRARGGIVIVVAHRPSALSQVNLVLFLRDGKMQAFGPRDEVLQRALGRPAPISAQSDNQPRAAAGARA